MFNYDPAWNILAAIIALIIIRLAIAWQRRVDQKKKINPGDSVTVFGAGDYRKVSAVRGNRGEHITLDGNEFPVYDSSALQKE